MTETAIAPGSDAIFASYKKVLKRPEVKAKLTQKDRLARLASSSSWKEVVKIIDKYIEHLTELRSIDPKDTVEAVGFRFLASQVAIEYLRSIKSIPERAKKTIKEDE